MYFCFCINLKTKFHILYKSKYEKVGVAANTDSKVNVSSVGPLSERNAFSEYKGPKR